MTIRFASQKDSPGCCVGKGAVRVGGGGEQEAEGGFLKALVQVGGSKDRAKRQIRFLFRNWPQKAVVWIGGGYGEP